MAFCSKCGRELENGANFCGKCGTPIQRVVEPKVEVVRQVEEPKREPLRREFYDGEVRRCPNCKSILQSGETYCRYCQTEIRGARAVSSVELLSEKLERINFDRSLNEDEKDRLTARTVKAFNIPNTKEDLLEFLDIAVEKKDPRNYGPTITKAEGEVISAWREKFRTAYQKAQNIIGDRRELKEFKAKYANEYNNNVDLNYEVVDSYQRNYYDDLDEEEDYKPKNKKSKWVRLFLCLFFGMAGAHKFYDNKFGMGILYLFTGGLFGFGWFIDIFRCLGAKD